MAINLKLISVMVQ